MRTGLVISAALASALVASTALADRTNDFDNKSTNHSKDIKERVIDQERTNYAPRETVKTSDVSAPKAVTKNDHRANGELYESYGKNSGSQSVIVSSAAASKAAMPAAISKAGEEMVDPKSSSTPVAGANDSPIFLTWRQLLTNPSQQSSDSTNYGPMGKQIAWTAAGKTVRSFTHMINDKGQLNNNPHGNTATAMHARHQMGAILSMISGAMGGHWKMFKDEGSGGDASEDQF